MFSIPFSFVVTIKSKTVKNKITTNGPKIKPFIPNKLIPPKIEKKITKG